MGIFEFVKQGVERLRIARPDECKDQVVYKHPESTIASFSQLTVDSDEVCLFFRDGQLVGSLGPGRHTLQTDNVPFLTALVDRYVGQGSAAGFSTELYFVTVRPLYNQPFGDSIGSMRDPELELRVTPRAYGTFSFRVVDPVRFVTGFVGQGGALHLERDLRWIRDQLLVGLREVLTRLIRAGELTLLDLGMAGKDVAREVVLSCPDLSAIGVQVIEVARLNLNLSDEDQRRVDALQDRLVEAKLRARLGRTAQLEREAERYRLAVDQNLATAGAASGLALLGQGAQSVSWGDGQARGTGAMQVACARCSFANPGSARFCSECGGRIC